MDVITITDGQVFDALLKDPTFVAEVPESGYPVWKEFVSSCIGELAELLDQQVSVEVAMRAKFCVLQELDNGDWITTMMDSYPDDAFGFLGRDGMSAMVQARLSQMLRQLPPILENVPEFLRLQGITEAQFFAHKDGLGFNDKSFAQYKSGNFTLANLLITQPNTIFKNS